MRVLLLATTMALFAIGCNSSGGGSKTAAPAPVPAQEASLVIVDRIEDTVPADVTEYGEQLGAFGPFLLFETGVMHVNNFGTIISGTEDMAQLFAGAVFNDGFLKASVPLYHYAFAATLPNEVRILDGNGVLSVIPTVKNYSALEGSIWGLQQVGTKWAFLVGTGGFLWDAVIQDSGVSENHGISNPSSAVGGATAYTFTTYGGDILRMNTNLTVDTVSDSYDFNDPNRTLVGSSDNLLAHVTSNDATYDKLTFDGATVTTVTTAGAIKTIYDSIKQFQDPVSGDWHVIDEHGATLFVSDTEIVAPVRVHQDPSHLRYSIGVSSVISGVNKHTIISRYVSTKTTHALHLDAMVDLNGIAIADAPGSHDYLLTLSTDGLRVFKMPSNMSTATKISETAIIPAGITALHATENGFLIQSGLVLHPYRIVNDTVVDGDSHTETDAASLSIKPSAGNHFTVQATTAGGNRRLYRVRLE